MATMMVTIGHWIAMNNSLWRYASAIFSYAYAVTVKSHCDSTVGIPCVDEILWHVEVCGNNAGKCVVGFAVGCVRSPVGKGFELLFRDWVL